MYTETELREALEHSASRADTLTDLVTPRRPKRHFLPAAAAAAVVVTVVAGAAALQGSRHQSPPPARDTHAPAQVHVPVDLNHTIDQMRAGEAGAFYLLGNNEDVAARTEIIDKQLLPTRNVLKVTLVDSTALDPARIPRDRPVPIAGTTGYFSKFKLHPLNGGPGGHSRPIWTIAFQDPAGKWVFVSIATGFNVNGVANPAEIAAEYAKLHINFVNDQTRLPFRTGYVPNGYRLEGLQLGSRIVEASLINDDTRIQIAVAHTGRANGCVGTPATACPTRRIGDYTISVGADRYRVVKGRPSVEHRLARRVFDSLQVASNLNDPATYWTIADALG